MMRETYIQQLRCSPLNCSAGITPPAFDNLLDHSISRKRHPSPSVRLFAACLAVSGYNKARQAGE
jgi:hypothetical protein